MKVKNGELVKIDGVWLPAISGYEINREDLDSTGSGRSDETGMLHRNRIRARVKKIHFTCKASESQLKTINSLILGEDDIALDLYFFNPFTCEYDEGKFYVSKDSAKLLALGEESYWLVQFNAIEY